MDSILICFFVLITGACIGSFLNVVALRAISGESIVFPSSKCPKCNTPIKWYDNIPVFSYFFTIKGKCRNCGEKVSLQYPIVEALTAVLFLAVILAYGITIKSLLLLILLCVSIVISITDLKKEYIYDVHSWIFIITALIYSIYVGNCFFAFLGFISGAVIMEVIAKLSYYLVRKETSEEITESESETEEENITGYVNKNKRAFGEGDTYLAAGAGALLGIKYFIAATACAIIFQALCILPQFIINLYKQKEKRLIISILAFFVLAVIYFVISNITELNLFVVFAFIIALIFFAFDTITRLKKTVNNNGFKAIPFGPALLVTVFVMLFFGSYITSFIKHYIFMIGG